MIPGFKQVAKEKLGEIYGAMGRDELAYLALTGKVELPMGNKLAWLLQGWAAPQGLAVAREWARAPGGHVDIAVLRGKEPEALLELKAMMTFDPLRAIKARYRAFEELRHDMERWSSYEGAEVIGILFAVHLKSEVPANWIASKTVKYADGPSKIRDRYSTPDDVGAACSLHVKEFFDGMNIQLTIIPAGRCFETDVEVMAWLIS